MRFMIIRMADAATEAGMLPTEHMLTVMGNYMKQMSDAGILLGGEGLKPSSDGVRVKSAKAAERR